MTPMDNDKLAEVAMPEPKWLECETPGADFDTTFVATMGEAKDMLDLEEGDEHVWEKKVVRLFTADQLQAYGDARAAAALAAQPKPEVTADSGLLANALHSAIHWPECWDTAAYPTARHALEEVYAHFRCTQCEPASEPGTCAQGDNCRMCGHPCALYAAAPEAPAHPARYVSDEESKGEYAAQSLPPVEASAQPVQGEPARKRVTHDSVHQVLRSTGYVTNSQAHELAEAILAHVGVELEGGGE